ncbi:hypothetical protein V8E55_007610 [Tylopilus felleus]
MSGRVDVEDETDHHRPPCQVDCVGFEWGTDTTPLLRIFRNTSTARCQATTSLSCWFNSSHGVLLVALTSLLAKARVWVRRSEEESWMGSMIVSGLEHDTAHDAKARFERWNDAVCTRWNMHVIDSSFDRSHGFMFVFFR